MMLQAKQQDFTHKNNNFTALRKYAMPIDLIVNLHLICVDMFVWCIYSFALCSSHTIFLCFSGLMMSIWSINLSKLLLLFFLHLLAQKVVVLKDSVALRLKSFKKGMNVRSIYVVPSFFSRWIVYCLCFRRFQSIFFYPVHLFSCSLHFTAATVKLTWN